MGGSRDEIKGITLSLDRLAVSLSDYCIYGNHVADVGTNL